MRDENSVYPKVETSFTFKPHMNDVYVEAFNDQSFNRNGSESAILKINYYNPANLIIQHLPVKEKVENIENYQMRNSYIIDTLNSVDIQKTVKIRGKVIEIYKGVIYREKFEKSPFRRVLGKLFALRQKYKDEVKELWQGLVKLTINSLYGVQGQKDINEFYRNKSEHWMQTEYDDNVLDYWKLPNRNYVIKFKKDDGLDGENDVRSILLLHLGAFIFSKGQQNKNIFVREINGFYKNSMYYGNTDSIYIEKILGCIG